MKKLSTTDFMVWNYINSYSKNDKPFFGSNEYLSEKLYKSKSVISHSISRLLKTGYIENKGHKYYRKLYAISSNNIPVFNIAIAENSISNAKNSNSNAENSISYELIERAIAEISNCEKLKTSISKAKNDFSNAENSYILIKLLIKLLLSYTNKKEEVDKNIIINNNIKVPDFINLEIWNDFINMRKLIKKPATERAKTNLIKKLTDFHTEGIDPNECLNNSITNNWQDIFKPKNGASNEKNLGNKFNGFNYTTGGKPSIGEAVERTLENIKNGSF